MRRFEFPLETLLRLRRHQEDLAAQRLAEIDVRADVVLADLGFSSNQMEDPQRGFGFKQDAPLDMRLDPSSGTTAAELVALGIAAALPRWERAWRRASTRARPGLCWAMRRGPLRRS